MGQVQVGLRVSPAELAAIEAARGTQSRESFIRRMVKEGLARDGQPMFVGDQVPASAKAPRGARVLNAPSDEEIAQLVAEHEATS